VSKYNEMCIEDLMKELKRRKMPVPNGQVAKELMELLEEQDTLIKDLGPAEVSTDKYPETKFTKIGIASFFHHNGKLCIKYDEKMYLELDTVREICSLKEGHDLKGFDVNVCDITISYKQSKRKK